MVEETGIGKIKISWTASSAQAPDGGYQILINSTHNNTITVLNVMSSPHSVSLQHGVYSMQLVAVSQKVIYELPSPLEFIVQGSYGNVAVANT